MNDNQKKHTLFFEEIKKIVGSGFFYCDQVTLDDYSKSTLFYETHPIAVACPATTEEVSQIILVANKYKIGVHPISTGKNWGYSDARAQKDGALIINLNRLNRVLEVNKELCYAVIQTGVTQKNLFDFLKDNKIDLWMDATGADENTSIIGNISERGFGYSIYGERFLHSCAYEVVLPNGKILNTGFGEYSTSKVSHLYKWGLGPSLDGMFTQSNFGIITKMTIHLLPKPECFKALFFSLESKDGVFLLVDTLRYLRLNGVLHSIVHISNDIRLISSMQRSPVVNDGVSSVLSEEIKEKLSSKYKIGAWFGVIPFYGFERVVKEEVKVVKKKLHLLKDLEYLFVFDNAFINSINFLFSKKIFSSNFLRYKAIFKKVKIIFFLLQGKAPESSLQSVLWRASTYFEKIQKDPFIYNSGMYWVSPVVPMSGNDLLHFFSIVEPIFSKHGFDCAQTISTISDRAVCVVLTIYFDKKDTNEALRAKECHDSLMLELFNNGYIVYRMGTESTKFIFENTKTMQSFLSSLKKAIDENGILSEGKYGIS